MRPSGAPTGPRPGPRDKLSILQEKAWVPRDRAAVPRGKTRVVRERSSPLHRRRATVHRMTSTSPRAVRILLALATSGLLAACGAVKGGLDAGEGRADAADAGLASVCPRSVPTAGTPCSAGIFADGLYGLACEYGTDPSLSCDTLATCAAGTWKVNPQTGIPCTTTNSAACPASFGDVTNGGSCADVASKRGRGDAGRLHLLLLPGGTLRVHERLRTRMPRRVAGRWPTPVFLELRHPDAGVPLVSGTTAAPWRIVLRAR